MKGSAQPGELILKSYLIIDSDSLSGWLRENKSQLGERVVTTCCSCMMSTDGHCHDYRLYSYRFNQNAGQVDGFLCGVADSQKSIQIPVITTSKSVARMTQLCIV